MDRDNLYKSHLQDAVSLIETFIKDMNWEAFVADPKTQSAVVRQLEVIGEAANRLSSEFCAAYPDIPWKDMVGLRNRIAHEYMNIDLEVVWSILEKDLPKLKVAIVG